MICGCHERNGLYVIEPITRSLSALQSSACVEDIKKWLCRLGHLSFNSLRSHFSIFNTKSNVNGFEFEVRLLSKKCRTSYPISINEKSQVPSGLIHSDVVCSSYLYFWSSIFSFFY